jgi:hypothetical protein
MTLDYSQPGCVEINMSEYVRMALHDLPDSMMGAAITPAANHLFEINEDSEKLDHEQKGIFVHYVMQLLYLSQRGQPDIRTAISFLCTQLRQPNDDDFKKLVQVLIYLQSAVDLPLILSDDNVIELR